jgi:hypothetical protein
MVLFQAYPPFRIALKSLSFALAVWVALDGRMPPAFSADSAVPPPSSDGCVLHVDFENYLDEAVGILNAGIRQLGDPFTEIPQHVTEVTNNPALAYEGERSLHTLTLAPEQRGQVFLQRRREAKEVESELIEFVYRVTAEEAVDLRDFLVWSASGYRSGEAGVALIAQGSKETGLYRLDIRPGREGRSVETGAVRDLQQAEWIRVVLKRNKGAGTVDIWVGSVGKEQWLGAFPDQDPEQSLGRARLGDIHEDGSIGGGYWDNIRIGQELTDRGGLAPAEPKCVLEEEWPRITYPIEVGSERQLFVDDAVIAASTRVQRVFHYAEKHPRNPLLVPQTSWEVGGVYFVPYETIQEKPGGPLRVWYGSYRKSDNKKTYTCIAESTDGLEWRRPAFGLFDFEGSKDNNIVWDGRVVRPHYDPEEVDPARRYKGMTRTAAFTPLYSPNGVHWTLGDRPAIEQAYDASSFSWDPIGKKWIASCKLFFKGKRARGYAEGKDLSEFGDTRLMLHADESDHPQDELYALRILRYESVYVGLLKIFHVATDRCDLQVVFSRDAKHWSRPHREPFLANSEDPTAPDYGNLDEAGDPIRMGDELWFYYGGRNILHYEKRDETSGSLCLAALRSDGFASMKAGEEPGVLLTQPLKLRGNHLHLNFDAEGGEVSVEVLSADENRPHSSPERESNPMAGDSVDRVVSWKHGEDLQDVSERPVRLRFHLRNAGLYSFWTE